MFIQIRYHIAIVVVSTHKM